MAEKIVIELEVDASSGKAAVKGFENDVKDTQKELSNTGSAITDVSGKIDNMTNGAVSGFKNVVSGVKSGIKSMGVFKLAVAATGIGLLVTATAALIEYFTNFEKPLQIVDATLNAIGGAINAIVDNFGKLLTGDFIGFFNSVADATIAAVDATNDLYDAEKRLFELQKQSIVQNQILKNQIEENLKLATDTTLGIEERLAAQKLVNESSEQLIKNERELAAIELERLKAELAIENNYKARRDLEIEIEQTTADLMAIEGALNRQRLDASKAEREILAQDKAAKDAAAKEESDRLKEITDERKEALLQIEAATRTANEKEIFDIREKYTKLLELARQFGQDEAALKQEMADQLNAIDPKAIDPIAERNAEIQIELEQERELQMGKTQIQVDATAKRLKDEEDAAKASQKIEKLKGQATLSVVQTVANTVAQIAGEQSVAGKAAAIAATTIATFQSATNSFNALSGIPIVGPALGGVAAAAAVVAGIANVKKILAVKTPNAKGGGGGGGGAAPSISAPSVGNSIGLINPVGNANGIGEGITNTLDQNPPRAYVVAEDVENGLDLDNKIKGNADFG